tara:strand:- start:2090 stop:2797 length:708 start_codon:yes stop_codon:yes gene_type:complete
MRKIGIIGSSVSDSASPEFHNKKLAGNIVRYIPIEKKSLTKRQFIFLMNGLVAANVTSPFKDVAYSSADWLTPEAIRCRSVNLLYWKRNLLIGDNTDTLGFGAELLKRNISKTGTWLVLGSGGAGRACCDALLSHGCKPILASRNKKDEPSRFQIINYEDFSNHSENVFGIVNATPVELPYDNFSMFKNCVYAWDLNYKKKSKFLELAELANLNTINGRGMFENQARYAYFRWIL